MDGAQSFDRFAADYNKFSELEKVPYRSWVEARLPKHGGRAVDLGCGSGRFTVILAERFDEVMGVDISKPLLEIANRKRARRNIQYRLCDLNRFREPTGFDFVFSATTLHHVPDLADALSNIRRLVKPGGQVMLIDNVAPRSPVPRWRHAVGAIRRFPADAMQIGLRKASWLLEFQVGSAWLDHLASDHYLTRQEFERAYNKVFPGAEFTRLAYVQAMFWVNHA